VWIVDSSVWIDFFNGVASPETDLLDAALGQREFGLITILQFAPMLLSRFCQV
jgi:hypothetical protein